MKYVGILTPETNIVVEDEIIQMISEEINILKEASFHFSRIEIKKDYSKNKKAFFQEMHRNIGKAFKLFKTIPLNIAGIFCTSAILFQKLNNKYLAKELDKIPILEPLSALVFASSKIKPKNVLLFSPYNYSMANSLEKYLEDKKVPISKNIFLNINKDIDKYNLDQAKEIITKSLDKKIDLILISCTNFRSLELITFFENKFKIPVISSNQALFWMICKKLNVKYFNLKKYGFLFQF